MANLGLLGALGGIGQAMTTIGTDMVKRREQALAWLREDSKYQRERADKQTDTKVAQEHQSKLIDQRAAAQLARDEKVAAAREKLEEKKLQGRATLQEDEQKFRAEQKAAEIRAQKAMEVLKAALGDSSKERELRAQLAGAKGVQYGPVDDKGMAELMYLTKGGELKSTGKKVLAPKSFRTDLEEEDEGL